MPSHVTHGLFALDAWRRAFDGPLDAELPPWILRGAVGPDPFFSGIGRRPSGQRWGYRAHREGFGRMAASIARQAAVSREAGSGNARKLRAYAIAFATHAILDRAAHPMVNYFSGWVDPSRPDTGRYEMCHPFLERIIDMVLLRDHLGTDPEGYAYPRRIPSQPDQERLLVPVLHQCLREAYPEEAADDELEDAVRNALRDDADFLALFDPSVSGGGPEAAIRMEARGELPPRALSLFYPDEIPPGDFLNEDGSGWTDPRRGGEKRMESFMDLYTEALSEAAEVMVCTSEIIAGKLKPEVLEQMVGNGDLNDRAHDSADEPFVYCAPLELGPLIDGLYETSAVGTEAAPS